MNGDQDRPTFLDKNLSSEALRHLDPLCRRDIAVQRYNDVLRDLRILTSFRALDRIEEGRSIQESLVDSIGKQDRGVR
jgi:hypothetical protein